MPTALGAILFRRSPLGFILQISQTCLYVCFRLPTWVFRFNALCGGLNFNQGNLKGPIALLALNREVDKVAMPFSIRWTDIRDDAPFRIPFDDTRVAIKPLHSSLFP